MEDNLKTFLREREERDQGTGNRARVGGSASILLASGLWTVLSGSLTAGASLELAQRASKSITEAAADELATEQDEVLKLLGEG